MNFDSEHIFMRKLLLLSSILFLVNTAQAQLDSTRDLEQVVVTGQYKPQSAKNSVYQVRTITHERIQTQGAPDLQTVLQNELNIRFSQDMATGGSNITMMGLQGQNVKILVDGLPLVGRQGTSNEININQIDINSIDRIEVVEGPMSVVYGADALAGVINIITKKATRSKLTVTAKLQEETVGKEYGTERGVHNQSVSAGFSHKKWEFGGGFSHNYFGGWKDTAVGRELVWHRRDQLLANGFIGYRQKKFGLRYRMDGVDEIITNPGDFLPANYDAASGDTLAFDQDYLTTRVMHQLQGDYTPNNRFNVQLQSAYTDYKRQVFSTTVSKATGDVRLDDGTDRQSIVNFRGFTFRSMVNYTLNKNISFQPGIDINTESGEGERLKAGTSSLNDYAAFITAEITPVEKLNIRPGLRFVKNSVYNAPPIVPSLNAKYSLSKHLDWRMAYARGFRAPSLRELYFNFFDANHQILGNPDLKAETSNSFTTSLSYKKLAENNSVAYSTVLSGFYNVVDNMIDYAVSASNPNIFILTNVLNSKTAGGNVTTLAKYKTWNFSLGFAYTGFNNDYANAAKSLPDMKWSGEINATAGYTFSKIGLDANIFYKLTGKRPYYALNANQDVVLTHQEGYHMLDVTLNKKAFKYLSFSAGARNLLNVDRIASTYAATGVHTSNGVRNIAYGRSFFAGLSFNLSK